MLTGFTEEEEANLRSKKPSIELVQKLISIWEDTFTKSAYDSLVAVKVQLKKWNTETSQTPSSMKLEKGDDVDKNKEFEYTVLYFKNALEFNKIEQELQKMLTPSEVKQAEKAVSDLNDAERIQRMVENVNKV
jgi:hypothetical protein